jgi:trimeric autotransporter adhesin
MNASIQLKKVIPVFLVALTCFGLSPMAQALLPPPPPDGCYPNANTAEGCNALFSLTIGNDNTAIGFDALYSNKSGNNNTANGSKALVSNTTGNNNTANGVSALYGNTSGNNNTASGYSALLNNQTGGSNTANGYQALASNIGGSANTANGFQALRDNATAFFNTATGSRALFTNTTGFSNTANGYQALYLNETGGGNTATGVQALYRTTGGNNIALGFQAGVNLTTGSNNIDIGNVGVAAEANTIRIGKVGTQTKAFIAGISGSPITGTSVVVNSNGRLGTTVSSARFKEAIKPMDKASEAIHALKPVTFRYKQELDPEGIPQFGLIAEHVEKVNPDLVARDADGKVYTVRYEAVNAMLLNEFLKEHRKNEEQEATIARQQKQIEALTAGLQKVSAQIELIKPAPHTVVNNQESSRAD